MGPRRSRCAGPAAPACSTRAPENSLAGIWAVNAPTIRCKRQRFVNEVFIRLIDGKKVERRNRAHFFAMATRLMRRILVDAARARKYQKRGGNTPHVSLDEALVVSPARGREIVALDDALEALAKIDARKSQIVELRYFGGLSVEDTAEALHVSPETVMRDWRLARGWLLRELSGQPQEPDA